MICVFFFFKQKTAYEMRISDWSSDVCSSDLARARVDLPRAHAAPRRRARHRPDEPQERHAARDRLHRLDRGARGRHHRHFGGRSRAPHRPPTCRRPEEPTPQLQPPMPPSSAVLCLTQTTTNTPPPHPPPPSTPHPT